MQNHFGSPCGDSFDIKALSEFWEAGLSRMKACAEAAESLVHAATDKQAGSTFPIAISDESSERDRGRQRTAPTKEG